jgi:uncharacterized protein YvpB
LPESAQIKGVKGHAQNFVLSCESRSAVDWAAYWDVHIREANFLNQLPRSDNPDKGFVGRPNDPWGYIPPRSYGVHAGPVAALLREYGLDAEARYDMSWDELRSEIAAGRPVIVWIIGRIQRGKPIRYKSSDGDKTIVARYEHTVIVTGYGPSSVDIIDAATGESSKHSRRAFLASWRVLGNMAVTGQAKKPETPPLLEGNSFYLPVIFQGGSPTGGNAASIPIPPEGTHLVQSGESLAEIAQQYNIRWRSLVEANHLLPPYTLIPGQNLIIPKNQ